MVGQLASPRFVGRTEELMALEAMVARVREGVGSTALVAAEAGIGKSRLIAEFEARARADGVTVLVGECVPVADGDLSYAPITAALRPLARGLERSNVAMPGGDLSGGSQTRLFEELLDVIVASASGSAPVVLVIEDIHWADRSTLQFLAFLVRAVRREHVAVVVSYRSDEPATDRALRRFLVELQRSGHAMRLELTPFTCAEVEEQVAAILGTKPERALVERLFERSEGNPFFAEELLASAGRGEVTIPASLRDALLWRIDGQPANVRRVIEIAAVAGRTVDHVLLARTAALPDDELRAAARAAVDCFALVHDPGSRDYAFRHALLREAVYAELLPEERRRLHAAVAGALDRHPELIGRSANGAAELAYHYRAAGMRPEALTSSLRAALAAEEVYGYAEALSEYERALELWPDAEGTAVLALDRSEAIRRAAEAASIVGATHRAIELAESLLARIDERRDPRAAALGRERLARYTWDAGRGTDALPEYRRAVELLPQDAPPDERAFLLAAEAQALMLSNHHAESAARCEEALAIAREVRAEAVQAHVLDTSCENLIMDGDYQAAIASAEQARDIARRLGLVEELSRSYVNGSDALDVAGRVEESIALALTGIRVLRELGADRRGGDFLRVEVAGRLLRTAHWSDADQMLAEVLDREPVGVIGGRALSQCALLHGERGEFEQASHAIAHASEMVGRSAGSMWVAAIAEAAATAEIWSGRPEMAVKIVSDCLQSLRETEHVFYTARLYELSARANADIAAHDPGNTDLRARSEVAARAALDRLDAIIAATPGEPPPYALASRSTTAGEVRRIADSASADPWSDAAQTWDTFGNRYHAAYARWRQAEALLTARPDRRTIRTLVRDATDTARTLGARPLLHELEALARRARIETDHGDLGPDNATRALEQLELTPREVDVLELLAEGKTNREIASQLFISNKTASVHVSHILTKLSVPNRAAAAATAQRLGIRPREK